MPFVNAPYANNNAPSSASLSTMGTQSGGGAGGGMNWGQIVKMVMGAMQNQKGGAGAGAPAASPFINNMQAKPTNVEGMQAPSNYAEMIQSALGRG